MKTKDIEKLTVSDNTKEWVRRIVELDELQDRIRAQIKARNGSEAATANVMERDFKAFSEIHKSLLYHLGESIYENITDIGSTQI